MVILAWICGLGLITWVFSGLLEAQFNPNQSPESRRSGEQIEVILEQNRAGHYVATGSINRVPVVFLIDTGATDVSIPAHLASTLNLTAGRPALARTANGTVRIAETTLDRIAVGDIELQNVDANLNPGMQGDHILLGMSFLKQLEFTQRGNALILRSL
ncbi:TIGR02281 family clan AA aspartic protease [Alteromonas sp. SM 2104]|nr:TIGR02281 family clan AA aspartic protease [Alteromonas oceanisediminis]